MSKCVMENCEEEGGRLNIRFNAAEVNYEATVAMCHACWKKMKAANPAECFVKFSEVPGQFIDMGISGRLATVHQICMKAEAV